MFTYLLYILVMFLVESYCIIINQPQFESDWLPIVAQTTNSDHLVQHGLGVVPDMVEVLVRAIDGPNEGFIFKATGNTVRDDDLSDLYGGIIYIYNAVSVRVWAPNVYNQQRVGAAIYTGDAPYWVGVNNQRAMRAEVKVRCWSSVSTIAPCVNISDIYMKAASTNIDDTYKELNHNVSGYPSLVKVRARLIDGPEANWYTDAQGSSVYNMNSMTRIRRTGGLKFSYNNETVRIWTSSETVGILFTREDGWGNSQVVTTYSLQGAVEVRAWCSLVDSYKIKMSFGPEIPDEQLQISVPEQHRVQDNLFLTVLIQAVDGANRNYLFEGLGSAATNTLNVGQPCGYGGLVYAYNDTTIRFWRPDQATGAAICIPDNLGHGVNSQAARYGSLFIGIFESYIPEPAEEYKPVNLGCSHFTVQDQYNITNSSVTTTISPFPV